MATIRNGQKFGSSTMSSPIPTIPATSATTSMLDLGGLVVTVHAPGLVARVLEEVTRASAEPGGPSFR